MYQEMFGSIPYIPGHPTANLELFSRHLPPIRDGIVSAWLKENVTPGSWILDPFGASPRLALEAAQAGYRVLVAANNPITRFILEMIANPPAEQDLKASLAELAASYVGNDRIEPHIRSLYNTTCARCGQVISADAFLWEHGNPTPYARIYTCPYCGDTGEHPSTPIDAENSAKFSTSGLHKARALERVVGFNDPDRVHVEQALSIYSPRALYALVTLINKVEGLHLSSEGQKHLEALLLYAFDQANSMWRPQAQNDRHRQLTIPRHSRENNIWLALEEGISKWKSSQAVEPRSSVSVTTWPNLPATSSGICIFEGRLISLADSIKKVVISSVCAALPRPNQAYWTLSALWAGWLWGRESVSSLKSVLHRQRYDWAWHANALGSVFKQLNSNLKPGSPVFGLIGEAEPGFIGSALVAAAIGGCQLEGMALRPDEKQAHVVWKIDKLLDPFQLGATLTPIANQGARRYLELNAEPASYLSTVSAALIGIVNHWYSARLDQPTSASSPAVAETEPAPSPVPGEPAPSVTYSSAYNSARDALSYRMGFLNYSLQDETNIEVAAKMQTQQTTLFTLDSNGTSQPDDEFGETEPSPSDTGLPAAKQRSPRSSEIPESSYMWLREISELNHQTSTDKYEEFVLDYIVNHPGCNPADIDQALCAEFTGLFTPDAAFVQLCLDSYGTRLPQLANCWSIRPEDDPGERQAEITRIHTIIHEIGHRLQFTCSDYLSKVSKAYISWQDEKSGREYWFFITSTASIGDIVIHGEQPSGKGFIICPASRTNLLIYKLRRDPRLNKAFDPSQGVWQLVKFRHIRSLHESPLLNRENVEQMLGLDPLTYTTPQLWLI